MKTNDFNYNLPKKFIAQKPVSPRDSSKLMVFNTKNSKILHRKFRNITEFLQKGDVLVVNRSKVIPARIIFKVSGKEKEVFLLRELKPQKYKVLVRPGRFFKIGAKFFLDKNVFGEVLEILDDGTRIIGFNSDVEKFGEVPIPPYIKNKNVKFSQYQTVYAKEKGSVAAPTAGFHFTSRLLRELRKKGVQIEEIILHVGRGTFLPVSTERITDHVMHSEYFEFSKNVAEQLNQAKKEGRRIIAVGTTSVRVLESCCKNKFVPRCGETDIFIYPGYKWRAVDALITNFHLPKSTLIMLVAAFLEGKGVRNSVKEVLGLYGVAKKKNYRFYSFGDSMLIL